MHPHFMNAELARLDPLPVPPETGPSLGPSEAGTWADSFCYPRPAACSLRLFSSAMMAMEILWKPTTPTEAGMLGAKTN